MDKELKELKSVLRSLVVSSPTQVDVRSLLRDYRNMMGAPVPLTKFGYRDPVLFLRERFSDCFVFQGPQNNPILTLIVPDALKHIDEFVQRQKLSSTVKFKGKRRSIPEQVVRKPKQNLIASTFVPNVPNNRQYNTPLQTKTIPTALERTPIATQPRKITKNGNINSVQKTEPEREPLMKSMNKLNIQDKPISKQSIVYNKENNQENGIVKSPQDTSCSQSALHNFLKKRVPLYNSSQHIEKYDIDIASSKEDDDSGRQTSSSSNSTKAALLEELKIEIRDLVAEHPEGVWCTDLIGLYRERYKRELNFSRFGYTSIISLVCVLEDVVSIERSGDGKWLLRPAAAAAAAAAPPRRCLPLGVARYTHVSRERVDPDDALPGIDFDPDVFPTDCMHFMESIPTASLSELEAGDMIEVILGEVYSPSHFWMQRLGPHHLLAMEDIMDEMTKYYAYGEGKDRSLALGAVRVGHYCSSVYEGDWHRSLIVRIQDCDTVKVRHIDYGTVESVSVGALKPLRREWAALPAQAVRARLAAVRPPAAGRRWPHAAAAHFLRLVRDTRLVANVVAVDREEDVLEVLLIDTSTDKDVSISAQMIQSGHADARADSALRTSECYLYPRFEALEVGATPNYGEIHAYLRDGIALEYVDEFRRHVPACLPPALPDTPTPPDPTPPFSPPAPSPPPSPSSSSGPDASDEDEPTADDEDDSRSVSPARALTPDSIEPARAPLARASSSPAAASPPPPRPAAPSPRPASAQPDLAAADAPEAPLGLTNRVPLRPQCPPFEPRGAPRPPRPRAPPRPSFHPPVRTPLPHACSQMFPMPGYAGFPPFPGAVPLYPPVYRPPPAVLYPHPPFGPPYGSPRPCHPPPTCPGPLPSPPAPPSCAMPPAFRPPAGPGRPSSPPPPYNGATGTERARVGPAAGDVTLSVSECEIFRLLSSVDPNAAHWYMVDAISRAMRTTTSTTAPTLASTLNPAAAEFRSPPRPPRPPQPRAPLPPGMRPPPGFGF